MTFTLRPYQREAVDAAVSFLWGPARHNAMEVLPTGSGKSLIIANIIDQLGEPVLVFQPSREILDQNKAKIESYGYTVAVYSASKGRTEVSNITLATIGSVISKKSLFSNFRYIIVDEAHAVNPAEGLYKAFLDTLTEVGAKVLGLTATPYRMYSNRQGAELRFITSEPRPVFKEMIYYVQNRTLFDNGYLAPIEYVTELDGYQRSNLVLNGTGMDYTDDSVHTCMWAANLPVRLVDTIRAQMKERKNVLVFTRFVAEARHLLSRIPGAAIVTGESSKKERAKVINGFKQGIIPVVCNVGVLTTGFDYPELETIIIARPTMSLALYYQMIGRCSRPHPQKEYARVIDMCGNYETFGRVEDLEIGREIAPYGDPYNRDKWYIASNGRKLTI